MWILLDVLSYGVSPNIEQMQKNSFQIPMSHPAEYSNFKTDPSEMTFPP